MVKKEIRRKWQRKNRKSWNRRPKLENVEQKRKGRIGKQARKLLRKHRGKK